jgi:hypothetical protein
MQHSALLLAAILQQEGKDESAAPGSQGQAPVMLPPAADRVLSLIDRLLELMLDIGPMAILASSTPLCVTTKHHLQQHSAITADGTASKTSSSAAAAAMMLEEMVNLPGLGLLSMHASMHQFQYLCSVLVDASSKIMGLELEIPGSLAVTEDALATAARLMDPAYKLLQLQVSKQDCCNVGNSCQLGFSSFGSFWRA